MEKNKLIRKFEDDQKVEILELVDQEKAKNQEIIRFNEQKNKLNDNRVMLKTLQKSLDKSDLTIDTHESEIYYSLIQKGIKTIYDLVSLDSLEKIDLESIPMINRMLLRLGINIFDKEQCKELIKRFNTEKNPDQIKVIGMILEDLNLSVRTFNCLKKRGFNTVYDIVKYEELEKIRNCGKKSITELKQKFMEFGIDLDNRLQCEELMNQYNNREIEKKEIEISEWKKEHEFKESNDLLENELTRKQKVLQELKYQLERKKSLQKQLIECDEEFDKLVVQYQTLNSKESDNNYGTK